MIKGIIFDFDGLILNTETILYEALNAIFTDHGSELPVSKWQEQIGTHTGFSPFSYLEELTGHRVDHQDLEARLESDLHSSLLKEKARPGVEDYLITAKELGLKLGLGSSSNYEWVSKYLKNLNLLHYFDCIRTAEDVEAVKPNPALYIQAAKCLGLQTAECLVFEDSANGAIAAKHAGARCVIVPNDITRDLDFCPVDYRLDSMADKELEAVLDIVKAKDK
ncbi:HAD family hydrolase [Lentibacillus sp.]|uniref:HAD family hydrolase n=1 Tax=Lentibacillus sp. TaxID=1925746 RepID=UPI002B4ADBC2|nr:HAD family hydrolase [Lentibacillus sp.]HLS08304.1 HAD family hydrolase [Lentibacillus sp.]